MSGRKVIAVIGATGAQDGGLVGAILNDPKGDFSARVLTSEGDLRHPAVWPSPYWNSKTDF